MHLSKTEQIEQTVNLGRCYICKLRITERLRQENCMLETSLGYIVRVSSRPT